MNALTEEEQIESLKRYVRDYGSMILLALLVSIASYFGYQGWQGKQRSEKETASVYYGELSKLAENAKGTMPDEQRARFNDIFSRLAENFPESGYASYAALHKARIEVSSGELDHAAQTLNWVIGQSPYAELKALARLRLARVELARGNLADALALLDNDPGAFAPLYENLRGDVLLEQDDKDKALLAYKKAKGLMVNQPPSMVTSLLDMKIASLDVNNKDKVFSKKQETLAE